MPDFYHVADFDVLRIARKDLTIVASKDRNIRRNNNACIGADGRRDDDPRIVLGIWPGGSVAALELNL